MKKAIAAGAIIGFVVGVVVSHVTETAPAVTVAASGTDMFRAAVCNVATDHPLSYGHGHIHVVVTWPDGNKLGFGCTL